MGNKTLEFLLALVCFVVSIIPIVFTAVLILLCTIYTKFLSIYLSRKYKTKIELLNGFDGLFALAEQKVESATTAVFVFEGEADIDRIKESVREQWTDVKVNGIYVHPKLRCTIAKASGYYYWLPERKFSLDDHIKLYECAPVQNDAEYCDVMSAVCNSPFLDDISPWTMNVVTLEMDYGRYAGKPHYGIIVRVHHSIADGVSSLTMIGHCLLDEKTITVHKPNKIRKISIFETIFMHFGAFFYLPFVAGWLASHQDSNVLHGPKQIGDRIMRISSPILLDRVKRVGKLTKMTVNDVMTYIVTGVLGRFYEKMGAKPLKPVHAVLPISLHTSMKKEFSNKVSGFIIELPLDVNYAFLERLKKIRDAINEQKKSFFYLSFHLIKYWAINRFPNVFFKVIDALNGVTLIISNLPGYQTQCYSRFGDKLKFGSAIPTHIFRQNLGFSIISYNGDIIIAMSADKSVVDSVESVEWVLKTCIEEFESLERNAECIDSNNQKIKF